MRSSLWIICLPLALLTGCAVGPSEPQGVRAALSGPTWEVTGYGENPSDAREQALEKARNSVEEYLVSHYPSLGWKPRIQTLLAENVVKVDDPKEGKFAERDAYEATAHVDLRTANLGKLQTEVDQAREQAQENVIFWRHLLVGRVLAVLVALFLIVSGYLRLEEMTRGYYTTLLRVGAGAVLLLIVAMVVIV
jgi:hypothetical protein